MNDIEFDELKEIIYGQVPSKSNSYKVTCIGGRGSMYKTKQVKDYEKAFMLQCRKYKGLNIEHFACYANIYYDNRRPDLDGSFKVFFDCLQKVEAIKNDNKCLKIVANKYLDKKNPRIEYVIIPVSLDSNQ